MIACKPALLSIRKLLDVLLNFITKKYSFTAASLRRGLRTDFTRFLWRSKPHNPNSSFIAYRFKSILSEATSSSFLLQMTLNHNLVQQRNRKETQIIKDSLYKDNLQGTVNSKADLNNLYRTANHIMQTDKMSLQE